jgi:hypothetical protein
MLTRHHMHAEVAQKFVDSRFGQFKDPQLCKKLVAEFPAAAEADVAPGDAAEGLKGASVLVLGDAAHVFPPGTKPGMDTSCISSITNAIIT